MSNIGGRIEISMEEYNALKDKIKTLEKGLNELSREAIKYKQKLDECQDLILNLKGEELIRRIFKWNEIIYPLTECFKDVIKEK